MLTFVKTLISLIGDGIRGLYYVVLFLFDLIDYSGNVFRVLPYQISGIIISLFTVSICIIVYKAIKG